MDISDVGGNMKHGAHIASIGGTWLALVYGFAGMRDHGGRISFRPSLPSDWQALHFSLVVKKAQLRVAISQEETSYRLKKGDSLTIRHAGEEVVLTAISPVASRRNPRPSAEEPAPEFPQSEEPACSVSTDAATGSLTSRQP